VNKKPPVPKTIRERCIACGTGMLGRMVKSDYCMKCRGINSFFQAFPNRAMQAVEHFKAKAEK